MSYRVFLKRSAERELDALPERVYDRLMQRILALGKNPRPRGTKKLTTEDGYRIRVGDYRILYRVDDARREVFIAAVAHRREVYR